MRNPIAPYLAIVLLSTVIFLVVVPQKTQCINPLAIAKGAVSLLAPFVRNFIATLRANREAESIKIKVWMHNGDKKLNGCGFFFMVHGYAGGSASGYFPKSTVHQCGNSRYKMRMTSQAAEYGKKLRLGNEQAKQIEVHADGWHNTCVNVMCIGMNERTIAGGPRAFCVNNKLLKGCKKLLNKWNDINIDWTDIMLTRTSRGAHKIIFREVEQLVSAFERLQRDPDDENAIYAVCDRIDLKRGTFRNDYWDCPAGKEYYQNFGSGNFYSYRDAYKPEDKNPYGCNRYTLN